jgi:hypothetical protein
MNIESNREGVCMKRRFGRVGLVAQFVLAGCGMVLSQAQAQEKGSPLATGIGEEFTSENTTVNGTSLHYVRGGKGPAIILSVGFQDWFEYHAIMPRLATRFTVITVDLRGVGGSTATPGGYDAANMAEDLRRGKISTGLLRAHVFWREGSADLGAGFGGVFGAVHGATELRTLCVSCHRERHRDC